MKCPGRARFGPIDIGVFDFGKGRLKFGRKMDVRLGEIGSRAECEENDRQQRALPRGQLTAAKARYA